MANSEWDKHLRDLLGDFKSEGETPHWDEFAQQLDPNSPPSEESDPLHDENLRDSLSNYKVSSDIEGWDRIQASLDAADREFDDQVRHKIRQYGPQYDPMAWPTFLKQLSESKLLRVKLIAVKAVEVAAVFLLLFTLLNLDRLGSLPFNTASSEDTPTTNFSTPQPYAGTDLIPQASNPSKQPILKNLSDKPANTYTPSAKVADQIIASSTESKRGRLEPDNIASVISTGVKYLAGTIDGKWNETHSKEVTGLYEAMNPVALHPETQVTLPSHTGDDALSVYGFNESSITENIAMLDLEVNGYDNNMIPKPKYVNQPASKHLEFGIIFQTDYNRLRMPEDKLFTSGRQIVFPQRGIPSQGFGAGFTIGIAHPVWALETGIIYSAKEFEPGRHLVVGDVFDNGSVDFEAMRLQLVSVPVQYRYRFEPKGRFKTYAIAGFGLHVIVQSDIDVLIKYNFPSLSIGENPNQDPNLANTIRETRRISEHFRDGAPFSTKSFLSVNAGLGMEYSLPNQKTLFLQTALQYQIPNLPFSNNSGKQIQTVSLQAGVRTPLGE